MKTGKRVRVRGRGSYRYRDLLLYIRIRCLICLICKNGEIALRPSQRGRHKEVKSARSGKGRVIKTYHIILVAKIHNLFIPTVHIYLHYWIWFKFMFYLVICCLPSRLKQSICNSFAIDFKINRIWNLAKKTGNISCHGGTHFSYVLDYKIGEEKNPRCPVGNKVRYREFSAVPISLLGGPGAPCLVIILVHILTS